MTLDDSSFQETKFGIYDINLDILVFSNNKGRERDINELPMWELRAAVERKNAEGDPAFAERGEIQRKFAIPTACLVFAIIGFPLGIRSTRAVQSWGIATSIGLILIYYLLLSLSETLGSRGSIPPEIALWIPNAVFFSAGTAIIGFRRGHIYLAGE